MGTATVAVADIVDIVGSAEIVGRIAGFLAGDGVD